MSIKKDQIFSRQDLVSDHLLVQILKMFDLGRFENGPAILPLCISFSIFSLAAKGFCITDFK
jgi:hypothetical protein